MNNTKTPLLSNGLYDALVWLVQIALPAAGTLYFALAGIWGLPNADKVVGTIVAVTVFLGVLLKLSSKSYNASDAKYDGELVVDENDPSKDVYRLEVNLPFEELRQKSALTLRVNKPAA